MHKGKLGMCQERHHWLLSGAFPTGALSSHCHHSAVAAEELLQIILHQNAIPSFPVLSPLPTQNIEVKGNATLPWPWSVIRKGARRTDVVPFTKLDVVGYPSPSVPSTLCFHKATKCRRADHYATSKRPQQKIAESSDI